MRYIKVLSMFVILAVALLLISTIRTYAGNVGATMIFDCDGDLFIVKSDRAGFDIGGCDTNEDCEPGDACADCIAECLSQGFESEDIPATGASGKSRYILTCPGCSP